MVYEDTYRLRQINDLKIQKDLNSISLLKKCIGESKEQTNKMTSLLDGIEIRLSGLHDLIVPVYDSTNTLQIKHSSMSLTNSFALKNCYILLFRFGKGCCSTGQHT